MLTNQEFSRIVGERPELRVTTYTIVDKIDNISYSSGPGKHRSCYITMKNGFIVVGNSFYQNPDSLIDNPDKSVESAIHWESVACKNAYNDAIEKLFELENYSLRERMMNEKL